MGKITYLPIKLIELLFTSSVSSSIGLFNFSQVEMTIILLKITVTKKLFEHYGINFRCISICESYSAD